MTDVGGPPAGYRPCVGIVLIDHRGMIFTGLRKDTPGAWQMPQGGIDPGESVRQAALRELKEETGTDKAELMAETSDWLTYDLPPKIAKKIWRGRFQGQAQKWVAMRFIGEDADIDITADGKHAEFSVWRWSAPEDVLSGIVDFKRRLYTDVLTEFAPLLNTGQSPLSQNPLSQNPSSQDA